MRYNRLTDSISMDELRQMYDNGMTQAEIADSIGVSRPTINKYLKGYKAKGGRVASRIPGSDLRVKRDPEREMSNMAEKNAENACLVVANKEILLNGTVGTYHVYGKDKAVMISVGGGMLDVAFDILPDFIDELKAVARNVGGLECGCEMW